MQYTDDPLDTELVQGVSLRILAAVSRLRYFTVKEVAAHAEVNEEAVQTFIRRHPNLIEQLDPPRAGRGRGRPARNLRLRPEQCERVAAWLAKLRCALDPQPQSDSTVNNSLNPLRMLEATLVALRAMQGDDAKFRQEIQIAELQLAGARANLRDRQTLSRPIERDEEQRLEEFSRDIEQLSQALHSASETDSALAERSANEADLGELIENSQPKQKSRLRELATVAKERVFDWSQAVGRVAEGRVFDWSQAVGHNAMARTTVEEGRVFDWSHAIGRNAARGPGFNYVQTMCLDKNGVLYTTNRSSENNFGMHCNKVQLGGPGEEDHIADFCEYGEGDGKCTCPFGVAVDDNDHVYVSDDWTNTISVFDSSGNFLRKWGKTGSGDGELLRPAGLAVEKNGNIIIVDSGNNRLQVFKPDGTFVGKCGRAGNGDGEFNQPWGITLDKDSNIYVADWKNHRVQKLSPEGKFLMKFGQYGQIEEPEGSFAVTMFGPYVSAGEETKGYPKLGTLNHPTDVAVDPDGDIYVTDWGNHRVCVFDSEGRPIANLIGDAQVLSKWGQQTVSANPDMEKARRRVKSLEPQWRLCFPTAVEFDPKSDQVIVADSQHNRLQIYKKVRDYIDFPNRLNIFTREY